VTTAVQPAPAPEAPPRGAPSNPALVSPGGKVGLYRIVEPVARGGFGAVYKAERDGRFFAVKIPDLRRDAPGMSRTDFERRVVREAATLMSLNHPNIVRVHGFDRWPTPEGFLYIVMDYVEGVPFHEWQAKKNPTLRCLCQVIETVARAVHEMHRHRIFHRDLKSDNVLVRLGDDTPVVVDLGIARPLGAFTVTCDPLLIGTPSHFAPEQVAFWTRGAGKFGEKLPVNGPADLHALGFLFYEALTGRPPFGADPEVDVLVEILKVVPPPPSSVNPRVPPGLDRVVGELLAKHPKDRYRTGDELARALAKLAQTKDPAWDVPFAVPAFVAPPKKDTAREGPRGKAEPEGRDARAGQPEPPRSRKATPRKPACPTFAEAVELLGPGAPPPSPLVAMEREESFAVDVEVAEVVEAVPVIPELASELNAAKPAPSTTNQPEKGGAPSLPPAAPSPEAPRVPTPRPSPAPAPAAPPPVAQKPGVVVLPALEAPPFVDPLAAKHHEKEATPATTANSLISMQAKVAGDLARAHASTGARAPVLVVGLLVIVVAILALAAFGTRENPIEKPHSLLTEIAAREKAMDAGEAALADDLQPPPPPPTLPQLPASPPSGPAPLPDQPKEVPVTEPAAEEMRQLFAKRRRREEGTVARRPGGGSAHGKKPSPGTGGGTERAESSTCPEWATCAVPSAPPPASEKKPEGLGVPVATHLKARLKTRLDSRTVGIGPVEAEITRPLYLAGDVLVPIRTLLVGRAAAAGDRFTVRFTTLRLPDDKVIHFKGTALDASDKEPGLPPSRRIAGVAPSPGVGVAGVIAASAAQTALSQVNGSIGADIAQGAGQTAVGAVQAGAISGGSGVTQDVLLLDPGLEFDVFVEES
jgi:eukaryotic-like serine/threonine-protein kinase